MYNSFIVPVVFCLLNGKTAQQYGQILQQVKGEIMRLTGNAWNPNRFILDFEQSMFTAIWAELPGILIAGCYFHFTQSLWHHIQNNGLVRAYQSSKRLKAVVKKVMAIACVSASSACATELLASSQQSTHTTSCSAVSRPQWLAWLRSIYLHRFHSAISTSCLERLPQTFSHQNKQSRWRYYNSLWKSMVSNLLSSLVSN